MNSHLLTAFGAFTLGIVLTLTFGALVGEEEEDVQGDPSRKAAVRKPGSGSGGPIGGGEERSAKSSRVPVKSGKESVKAEAEEKLAKLKAKTVQTFDREKWRKGMIERMQVDGQNNIDARLALWTERLGLSAAQAATLRTRMEQRLRDLVAEAGAVAEDGEFKAIAYGKRALPEEDLQALLAEVLTTEQEETYAALQEERRQDVIEAQALRRLADLQTQLDMSEAQRDQVFDVLHAQEVERGDSPPNGKQQYQEFIDGGGTNDGWREHYQELQRVARDEQVEQMSEILNERQLNAYRGFIERRGGSQTGIRTKFVEINQSK